MNDEEKNKGGKPKLGRPRLGDLKRQRIGGGPFVSAPVKQWLLDLSRDHRISIGEVIDRLVLHAQETDFNAEASNPVDREKPETETFRNQETCESPGLAGFRQPTCYDSKITEFSNTIENAVLEVIKQEARPPSKEHQ